MKKFLSFTILFAIAFLSIFTIKAYAAETVNFNVTTTKQTVHPGETVTVNIAFDKPLASYTIDVTYDNKLFSYESGEGGTITDENTKVKIYFVDPQGGAGARNNASVTFKAKTDITTTNPSNFNISATGLGGSTSQQYDDISVPITKEIIVEPKYEDYKIDLKYTGSIVKDIEKDMKIVINSSMGKNYEHTRIIAKVTAPKGGTLKLTGTDTQGLTHDIIQSGWGDEQGDSLGGKNVAKELNVKGLFDTVGTYKLTLSIIDRDSADKEIVSKTFTIPVKATAEENNEVNEADEDDNVLPKTGHTVYGIFASILAVITVAYVILKKTK